MFWFVTLRRYQQMELAYLLARKLSDERAERIAEQKRHIALLEEALALKTPPPTGYPVNREREERNTVEPITTGRGSFRARAAAASDKTVPKPPDSVEALNARVKEQGGKV